MQKLKPTFSDSNVYIVARYTSFFIASAASALFNIFLFTALDSSSKWILLALSIALEGAKLTTVLSINVLQSLYLKLKHKPLIRKARRLTGFYLIYAVLSITASLGFSIYITKKTETIQNSTLEILLDREKSIQDQVSLITNYKLQVADFESASSLSSYTEFPLWIKANEQYEEARIQYTESYNLTSQLLSQRQLIQDPESQEYINLNTRYQSSLQKRNSDQTLMNRFETDRRTYQSVFEQQKTDQAGAKERLADGLRVLNEELVLLIKNAGLETTEGSVALIQLKERIQEENQKYILAKGMAYMFEGFSEYTGGRVSPEIVKILILMLASILLELTIYQCAPDVQLSRWILKYFKRSLPENMSFGKILELFKEEIDDETDLPKEIEIKYIPKIDLPKKVEIKQPEINLEDIFPKEDEIPGVVEEIISGVIEEIIPEPKQEISGEVIYIPTEIQIEIPKDTKSEDFVVVTPKQEEIIVEDIKEEEKPIIEKSSLEIPIMEEKTPLEIEVQESKKEEEMVNYRFGKTTENIMRKLIEFISVCIINEGPFSTHPDAAAIQLKLSDRAKQVFVNQLSGIRLDTKPLIMKNKYGEYYSNFPADQIISYVSEIKEEK